MLSNNKIKYIQSLKSKKQRQKYNNFIIEGDKMAREVLQSEELEIEGVFALADWVETNRKLVNVHFNKILNINERELKKISNLTTPNQVLIIAKQWTPKIDFSTFKNDLSLYLDGIQDPGNMGTILRIADWFGIDWVICSPTCVEIYNPKVVQASMGAFLRVKTAVLPFETLQEQAKEVPVYGTVLDGENMYEMDLKANGIIVIGSEGKGISPAVMAQLNHRISIPAHTSGGAESLNAAIATGIVCALFRKGASVV